MKHLQLLSLFITVSAAYFGQTITQIEDNLVQQLEKINAFGIEGNMDSLAVCNQEFSTQLLTYAKTSSEMLSYNFPKIPKYYNFTASSPDGKLRIYSWDTQTGGSMRFYNNIVQWKDYDSLYAQIIEVPEGKQGGFYSEIFQLTDQLNTFYILSFNSILSGRDCYQSVETIDFEKNKLDLQFKKIKTKSGTTHKLGFSYNFFSVIDHEERPIKLIEFDQKNKSISIPVVLKDGKVSSKKIVYKYTGDYFVKQVKAPK